MLADTVVRLELHNAARNAHRIYELTLDRDLYGVIVLSIRYARKGTLGHVQRVVVATEEEGIALMRDRLRRRVSARKRVGAPYRVMDLAGPDDLVDQLHDTLDRL